jgi:hypothetical protein
MPDHAISKAVQTDADGTRVAQKRFNPLEMLELRRAVKARKDTVKLRGQIFNLRYEGRSFFYSPQKGFVPCGWLNIRRVENYVQDLES